MPKAERIDSPSYDSGRAINDDAQEALDEELQQRIRLAAYYRAMRRGFAPGGEDEDWFAAEEEEKARRIESGRSNA